MAQFIWLASFLALQVVMYCSFRATAGRLDEATRNDLASIPKAERIQEPVGEVISILRYGRRYRLGAWVVALMFLGFGLLMSILLVFAPQDGSHASWEEVLLSIPFYLMFGVLPWMFVLWVYGNACAVTSNGLLNHSWLGLNKFVRWKDIDHVQLVDIGKGNSAYKVKTNRGSIGISRDYENLGVFINMVQKNVTNAKLR
jgi:hypothetical protein